TLTLPALNAGAALVVSNFTAGGGQNVINISSMPPINAYPATITLISYRTGTTGNFTLAPLPPATPNYVGSLVDAGNGVIQLTLTAGPVQNLSELWTGAIDNNWDTTTLNWLQGTATNFFAGAKPTFDDTSSQPAVNLAESLTSGTVTVSNNVQQYDFTGPGNIAGADELIKKGSQTLTIDNQGVDNFGSVSLTGGTLQIGSGDVNGEISTLNISNDTAIVVNRAGTLNMSTAISGAGSLTNVGSGTLILSGANTYAGPTVVTAGGLELDGSLAGALSTASGTLLNGSGTAAGQVKVAGAMNPGPLNNAGTFTTGNPLILSLGATVTFDLSGSDPFTASANDSIAVGGDLTVNNNVITANFLGVPAVGNNYPIITYSGALSGSFNPVVTGSHFTLALDTTTTPGVVSLDVTGGTGANLKWTGNISGDWDSTSSNWVDLTSSAVSPFYSGDTVLLDDSASVPNITIESGVAVYPAAITNISDGLNYSISGAGKISGAAGIVKGGASTLTIATANDFTGAVDIQAGTLQTLLGTAAGATTVESNATLDVDGQSLAGEPIIISGPGVNGEGAIINSGGTVNTAMRSLTLAGDASIGGTGQWAINNSGGSATLSSGGQPYKLTKVGTGLIGLQNLSSVDPALGDIEVAQGTLEFNGLTPGMGDPNYTNIVDAGATLQFASDSVVWNKNFRLTGDGTSTTVNSITAANTELAGTTEIHGTVIFNSAGTLLTVSGQIVGDGGLTKNGSSPMVLSGDNTYTGDTIITSGALRLSGIGSIDVSSNIVIASGATLTATGRVDVTFTLGTNQTLSGNGIINGQLTTLAGSTVAPGISGVGMLTISNAVILGGTTTMELDQDNNTNDVLRVNSSITYGGALNLVSISSALTNGAS